MYNQLPIDPTGIHPTDPNPPTTPTTPTTPTERDALKFNSVAGRPGQRYGMNGINVLFSGFEKKKRGRK